MNRVKRRRDKARMKKRAKKVYPWWDEAYKVADHIKLCSCFMCCNRRKIEGPTRQEIRKDDLEG